MTGLNQTVLPHRPLPTSHELDHSASSEEEDSGVNITRSGLGSPESEYSIEESGDEEEYEEGEEDTWTNVSKDLGPTASESASRPTSAAHRHLSEARHSARRDREIEREYRPAPRHYPIASASVDPNEIPYGHGPPTDQLISERRRYHDLDPQGQYAAYHHQAVSPTYAYHSQHGTPQQHLSAYAPPQQPSQYPYAPYQQQQQYVPGGFPFPQARLDSAYGHGMGYAPPAHTSYQPFMPYPQIPSPQPIQYHQYLSPAFGPPPANSTPPAVAPPMVAVSPDTDAFKSLEKMLLAQAADRDAREAAAKRAQEDAQAALEAANKRAEDIKKAAEAAANDARTEAEKKAAAEKKKLTEEAEQAAAKAKADAEAAEKKHKEEKEAAVKAAEAAAAAAAATPAEKLKPIKFKDAVGRKFNFPFHLCRTWEGMEDLIRQAFLHIDVIGPHVADGHYDLMGPNNEIILPGVWETIIEPDWTITMHMWPIPEPQEVIDLIDVPILPEGLADDKKKGKKTVKKTGLFGFGAAPKPKAKAKAKASISAAAAAAAKK